MPRKLSAYNFRSLVRDCRDSCVPFSACFFDLSLFYNAPERLSTNSLYKSGKIFYAPDSMVSPSETKR